MLRAVVRFAIQPLVFEEHHGIVATNSRPQKTAGVQSVRRQHHPQSRKMREDHFAALAMVNGAAVQISADRDAHHQRSAESVMRAPAQRGKLSAQLHHGRPNIVEELDLDHRFHPALGQANGAADNARFRQRTVEAAVAAELDLQSCCGLKNSALAFHFRQVRFPAAIGHVLAEHDHARIRRISSCIVRLSSSTMVRASPVNLGSASNSAEVGSMLSE